ncbi:MAG: diguanylate cyclase, partial [Pseudomonadota bacterium]
SAALAFLEPLKLHNQMVGERIFPLLEVMEEAGEIHWKLDDVISRHEQFVPAHTVEELTKRTDKRFWMRFKVYNPEENPIVWYLTYDDPLTDYMAFYLVDQHGQPSQSAIVNDAEPFNNRAVNYRSPAINIVTPPLSEQWVYVFKRPDAVDANDPILFQSWSSPNFVKHVVTEYLIYGLLIGGMALMACYNLFLFFAARDFVDLYYVAYIVFSSIAWLAFSGLAFQFPAQNSAFIPDMGTAFFGTCAQIAIWRFTQTFLRTDIYAPNLHRLLSLLTVMSLIGIVLYFTVRASAAYFMFMCSLLIVLPFIGYTVWRQGFKSARFYTLAWTLPALGFVVYMPNAMVGNMSVGVSDKFLLAVHTFEVLLLSFALADRINRLREEKVAAEQQADASRQQATQLFVEKIEAEKLARVDTLSKLNNRRGFFELGEPVLQRATYDAEDVSIVMVDIDHFKKINDTYGHPAGDEVIKTMAEALRQVTRKTDIAGRLGGEEFALIIVGSQIDNIRLMAERLRQNIAGSTVVYAGHDINFTASFGVVAQSGKAPETLENLLARADAALYTAKQNGRNQVMVADTPERPKDSRQIA